VHLPGGNEENHERLQFQFLVIGPEFEPRNFRIRARIADLSTARSVESKIVSGILLIKLPGFEAFGLFTTEVSERKEENFISAHLVALHFKSLP
jgi:hypothetical protein